MSFLLMFDDGPKMLAPYTGVVATRGLICDTIHATNTQIMAQTRHVARDNITSLRLVYGFWAAVVKSGPTRVEEQLGSGTMTITASVSTDLTNWTRVQFGGANSVSLTGGQEAESDDCNVVIGSGATFYVRTYKSVVGGTVCYAGTTGDPTNNEFFRIGTSVTDVTGGGTPAGGTSANFFTAGPQAIIGTTRKTSVLLIGDSITRGNSDSYSPSATGDLGKLAPSIGAQFGYINAARDSDSAKYFLLSGAKRVGLSRFASHVICAQGRNDLDNGRSAAQIQADILSIAGLFSVPVWLDTISPMASSTDGFATVASQTTVATNSSRNTVNNWIRSTPSGIRGYFDSCLALENDPASGDGKWRATYTTDGQHPNSTGYAAVKSSGVVNPMRLL